MKKNSTHDVIHQNVTRNDCLPENSTFEVMPVDYDPAIDDFLQTTFGNKIVVPHAGLISRFMEKIKLLFRPSVN